MKIYATTDTEQILDQFIGTDVWVLVNYLGSPDYIKILEKFNATADYGVSMYGKPTRYRIQYMPYDFVNNPNQFTDYGRQGFIDGIVYECYRVKFIDLNQITIYKPLQVLTTDEIIEAFTEVTDE